MKKSYFSLVLILSIITCAYGQGQFSPMPYSETNGDKATEGLDIPGLRLSNTELLPDSTITYNADGSYYSKQINNYPGLFNGSQILERINYYWSPDNYWVPSEKSLVAIDKEGQGVLQEIYKWDAVSKKWGLDPFFGSLFFYQAKLEYNDDKLLISKEVNAWDEMASEWRKNNKYEYFYDTLGRVFAEDHYLWLNLDNDTLSKWEQNKKAYYNYQTDTVESNIIEHTVKDIYTLNNKLIEKIEIENVYNSDGNLVKYEDREFNTNDSVWRGRAKNIYAYNSNNQIILKENYNWNNLKNNWYPYSKQTEIFDDTLGLSINREVYYWNSVLEKWEESSAYEYSYDQSGILLEEVIYSWNKSSDRWDRSQKILYSLNSLGETTMTKYYKWSGAEWLLNYYIVNYPFKGDENQEVEASETQPVDEDNKGKFELTLTLPTEATVTGAFIIEFPEGISLDKENTLLSTELASQFELIFTPLENNSWKIEIAKKQQPFRSVLNEVVYRKILDVAYIVQQSVEAGTKIIEVKDLSFDTSSGSTIEQEIIYVNVDVRNGLSIENDSQNQFIAYITDNELVIQSPNIESGIIYSVSGTIVSLFTKDTHNNLRIDVSTLPKGIYIIKSESGIVQKAMKN